MTIMSGARLGFGFHVSLKSLQDCSGPAQKTGSCNHFRKMMALALTGLRGGTQGHTH